MTEVEAINFVDRCGGLEKAFEKGLRPDELNAGALRPILEDAYFASQAFFKSVSTFYDYAENCSFEE